MRPVVIAVALVFSLLQGTEPPVSAQEVDLAALSWMQGCWVAGGGDGTAEETWMAPRGGLMVAMARSVRGGRATGFEFVTLREVDGRLVFTARPSGQPPADFTAAVATGTLLRVENAEHDFPQKIEYHRLSPDSVTAKVFGAVGDGTPVFELRYGRSPC